MKQKLGLGSESFGRKAKDPRKKVHRVDLYPKVLVRPICGCCGHPMILGHSVGKYQSFFCINASDGIKGCTNRGYKSARIGNEDRQLKRLTERLAKLDDMDLDAVLTKAEEMGRQLAAKREQLKQLQRAGRRPNVKSVKAKDVIAALGKLCELLQGEVGVAAQVLKALVGDVVIEKQQVEGHEKPQMVARFTINAVPALAVLERGRPTDRDGVPVPVWDSIHSSMTGGRLRESRGNPSARVDSVRKSPARIILGNHLLALLF